MDLLLSLLCLENPPIPCLFRPHVPQSPTPSGPSVLSPQPLAVVIPLRPSAQQPPFPSDSILKLTLPITQLSPVAPPDGALSSAAPGSIPDTQRSPGCRCPLNSPLLPLSSCSPPWSESGSPDPPPSRCPSRRSPGPSESRRSEAPRAAEAEPGEAS